jgi:hypothetical protein
MHRSTGIYKCLGGRRAGHVPATKTTKTRDSEPIGHYTNIFFDSLGVLTVQGIS